MSSGTPCNQSLPAFSWTELTATARQARLETRVLRDLLEQLVPARHLGGHAVGDVQLERDQRGNCCGLQPDGSLVFLPVMFHSTEDKHFFVFAWELRDDLRQDQSGAGAGNERLSSPAAALLLLGDLVVDLATAEVGIDRLANLVGQAANGGVQALREIW